MLPGRLLVIVAAVTLSGCASIPPAPGSVTAPAEAAVPSEFSSCLSAGETENAYQSAKAHFTDLEGKLFNLRLEGRIHGEPANKRISLDPGTARAYLSDQENGIDIRLHGDEYSLITPTEGQSYGRNMQAGAMFDVISSLVIEEMQGEDGELGFADDLTLEEYQASCTELGGVPVLKFARSRDGQEVTLWIERGSPHRLLSATLVDPAVQDNFRLSLSWETVSPVTVKRTLPRAPAQLSFDMPTFDTNARGGYYLAGRFNEYAEWVPMSDIEGRLVDANGTVLAKVQLATGDHDLGEGGRFVFQDVDRNGLLSKGDIFLMDLAPGLDISFFDVWAKAPARVSATPVDASEADPFFSHREPSVVA